MVNRWSTSFLLTIPLLYNSKRNKSNLFSSANRSGSGGAYPLTAGQRELYQSGRSLFKYSDGEGVC